VNQQPSVFFHADDARLGDIAFSLVAPVLPRDAPFATQQIELRCRKRFC